MVWNTPSTWVAAATLTAAQLNAQLRDNFKAIGDPWTAWTPTWTATTTNPVIGNGSLTGGYILAGKLCHFWAQITMGSTTTYGTGSWLLDMPTAPRNSRWAFQGTARDTSASATYPFVGEQSGGIVLRALPTTAGNPLTSMSSTVPFTWATGDGLFLSGTYEAL